MGWLRMSQRLTRPLFVVGAIVAAGIIVIAVAAATFDPDDLKPMLIRAVQQETGRTLAIAGPIELSIFPRIGAKLSSLALSQPNEAESFISATGAFVSFEVRPLFARRLVVDRIDLEGLAISFVRYADGRMNYADLLRRKTGDSRIAFEVASISVKGGRVIFDDRLARRRIEARGVSLSAGPIVEGKPGRLELTADIVSDRQTAFRLDLDLGYRVNVGAGQFAFDRIAARFAGRVADLDQLEGKLSGKAALQADTPRLTLADAELSLTARRGEASLAVTAALDRVTAGAAIEAIGLTAAARVAAGARKLDAKLNIPSLSGDPLTAGDLSLDMAIDTGDLTASARLDGILETDLARRTIRSPRLGAKFAAKRGDKVIQGSMAAALSADLTDRRIVLSDATVALTLPSGTWDLTGTGQASADFARSTVVGELRGKLNGGDLEAKIRVNEFTPPRYDFDLTLARLDTAPFAGPKTGEPSGFPDLDWLNDVNANGSIRIGSLTAGDIRANGVRLAVRSR